MRALKLSKASNGFTKSIFGSQLHRQYSRQYMGCVEVVIAREVSEILNGI